MKILKDYENEITAGELLAYIKGGVPEMYQDDAEELLETIAANDALHPAAVYTAAAVTKIEGDTVWMDDIPFRSATLAKAAKEGDTVYPAMVTAGWGLEKLMDELDEPLQVYLNEVLMGKCLDDAALYIAKEICESGSGSKMYMAVPGIENVCPIEGRDRILELLPDALDITGAVLKDGSLRPVYSNTFVLYLGEGYDNLCLDWESPKERIAFMARLNAIAGHV